MAQTIKCSSCGATLNLGESWTHPQVSCMACKAVTNVPPATEKPNPKPPEGKPHTATEPTPPTATKAPVPTETKSYRKAIVAAIAATFAIGFLFGCCAASVVFWTFPREQGVVPKGVKGAVNKATGKPKDDMTFQELEDRLNAAGFKMNRIASRFGQSRSAMWFGKNLDADVGNGMSLSMYIQAAEDMQVVREDLFKDGLLLVSKLPDSKQAGDSALKITDIQRRPAIAWGPFVFQGNQGVLDNVRAALDK